MGKSIKLSVVIITFNEERNIKRCLDSIKEIADEIVIVDSFSQDKTKEISLDYGVRWMENPFAGHIEQKNFALQQASNDYVLSLDADEALSEKLLHDIKKIKADCLYDSYVFNRLTNYCGKWIHHCGWYPDRKLRLWNKTKGQWGGTNPHDMVVMQEGSSSCKIGHDILHYSYYSITDHIKQANYFTDIGARQAVNKGKTSTVFHVLLSPFLHFIKSYFLQLGFLDGYYGFVVSAISAHASFYKYLKMRELLKK
jgi:glycosyltransferase involved in cell wall biosynthesis